MKPNCKHKSAFAKHHSHVYPCVYERETQIVQEGENLDLAYQEKNAHLRFGMTKIPLA